MSTVCSSSVSAARRLSGVLGRLVSGVSAAALVSMVSGIAVAEESAPAAAVAPPPIGAALLQKPSSVDGRHHVLAGSNDVSVLGGFSVNDGVTRSLGGLVRYSRFFSNEWAFDVIAGGGLVSPTDTIEDIRVENAKKLRKTKVPGLADTWGVTAAGVAGLRWVPVYGKFNLGSELASHFSTELSAGAGAGWLTGHQPLVCSTDVGTGGCSDFAVDGRVSALGTAALGLRLFLPQRWSAVVEARAFVFPDAFKEYAELDKPVSGQVTEVSSPGWTVSPLVLFGASRQF